MKIKIDIVSNQFVFLVVGMICGVFHASMKLMPAAPPNEQIFFSVASYLILALSFFCFALYTYAVILQKDGKK